MRRAALQGFTLIELLIVLAIFAFTVSLAMPSFSEWIANARVKSSASAMQTYLDFARLEAGRRGRVIEVIITDDAPTTLSPTASDTGRNVVVRMMTRADSSVPEEVLKGGSLYSDSSVATLLGVSANTLAFNPFGRLTGGAAEEFIFATEAASRAVRLSLGVSGSTGQCEFSTSFIAADGSVGSGSGC